MDGDVGTTDLCEAAAVRRGRPDLGRSIESWRPRLACFIRRLAGSDAPAEDLAQEVLVRALEGAPRRRSGGRLSTWLFGIAANVCREQRREQARQLPPVDDAVLLDIPDVTLDPARIVERREEREALRRAFDRLSPTHREVLLLRDQVGLSYRQMAEALGVPVGTVRSRIHNATAILLQLVEDELR